MLLDNDAVTLQRIRSGLLVILDDKVPFYNLKKVFFQKMQNIGSYIYHTNTIFNFGSRELRDSDLKEFVLIAKDNFKLNVIQIISKVPEVHEIANRRGIKVEEHLDKSEHEYCEQINNEDTLWIKKSIRSGQLVEYRGNVVVLGDVSHGARIVAGGNVLVMGVMRGDIWAGKDGDVETVIISSFFKPSQLRISDTFLVLNDELLEQLQQGLPTVAYYKNSSVFLEDYKEWSLRSHR